MVPASLKTVSSGRMASLTYCSSSWAQGAELGAGCGSRGSEGVGAEVEAAWCEAVASSLAAFHRRAPRAMCRASAGRGVGRAGGRGGGGPGALGGPASSARLREENRHKDWESSGPRPQLNQQDCILPWEESYYWLGPLGVTPEPGALWATRLPGGGLHVGEAVREITPWHPGALQATRTASTVPRATSARWLAGSNAMTSSLAAGKNDLSDWHHMTRGQLKQEGGRRTSN
ncbi:hypothetical protein AAFF_G00402740 [Aldrovandia affinis]|uniref:Uncharacterized protein n=1 Tax=Aldrovandia affinis TaxID=143900 RepID=A0AAD7T890_9TELE|nr:hypothetical protein AAFF_G00402740 [Aldrovandia affinis]